MRTYLAIDNDIQLAESEAAGWMKQLGIGMERVDTMTQGILKLQLNKDYLYVGINGDTVDFMPLLKTMRSITITPILIATNHFTTQKEVAALKNGADLYARYHENTEGNIESVMAWIEKITEQNKQRDPIIYHKGILITPAYHEVFVNDSEIDLTKKEFDLLCFLMSNRGRFYTYEQIYSHVWFDDFNDSSIESIRGIIKRLRKKIDQDTENSVIENVHGCGYKMTH